MGLLDEAIREHLDLKRRSGADPSAVARAEREALAPVFPDEHASQHGGGDDRLEDATASLAPVGFGSDNSRVVGDEGFAYLSSAGQDTAELDMQAVMGEDGPLLDAASSADPITDGSAHRVHSGETSGEDALVWKLPDEREGEPAPEDAPGQERLSFDERSGL